MRRSTPVNLPRPQQATEVDFGHTSCMDSDAAELSSITTVVSDLTQRVADVAQRRGINPDDPIVVRLHEIERSLVTAQRRLRDVARAMDA